MEPIFFFYLTLGAVLFLVISMLLGHDDNIGHGHAGGHGHSFGHGHSAGHGHSFQHGHTGHTNGHGPRSDNMSIWSFQMLFLFTAGFGAGGYFGALYRLSAPVVILCGVMGGVILASIGYFIINIFYRRQGDSNIYSEEFIGLTGIVVTSINGDGVGQVRCSVGAQRETFLAKSADGNSIPLNSAVRITDMIGSTAVVEITDDDEQTGVPWRR